MSYTQRIYNRLRQNGLTEAAALGFLGNWDQESGNEPNRLQGDFNSFRTMSKAYVNAATNGSMSKQTFQSDQKGFGLAQWTYWSRKAALWDFWKASGKALDDATMQTAFALKELREDYRALLDFLKSTNDVFTATSRICREFERPAVNNIDARFQAANKIKYEIDLNNWDGGDTPEPEPTPQPEPGPEPIKPDKLELRTIDRNCNGFPEVYLVQALLLNRGYDVPINGIYPTEAVTVFQRHHNLNADGCCGPMTWAALMER